MDAGFQAYPTLKSIYGGDGGDHDHDDNGKQEQQRMRVSAESATGAETTHSVQHTAPDIQNATHNNIHHVKKRRQQETFCR